MTDREKNDDYSKAELDNHANQMNPNNDAYHSSRGISRDDDDDDNNDDGDWSDEDVADYSPNED